MKRRYSARNNPPDVFTFINGMVVGAVIALSVGIFMFEATRPAPQKIEDQSCYQQND